MNDCATIQKSSPLEERLKRMDEVIFHLDESIERLSTRSEPIRVLYPPGITNQKEEQVDGCQIERALISFEVRIRNARDRIKQLVDEFQI